MDIKFKVWDVEHEKYRDGSFTPGELVASHQFPSNWQSFYIFVPSTGKQDHNGVEIFEHDILQDKDGDRYIVKHDGTCFYGSPLEGNSIPGTLRNSDFRGTNIVKSERPC